MALLVAPYTHAMRLGQGFNSYTQQICVDDAVVVDDQRPENVVTNDGTTMRIMAQKTATPSAWTRQKEVVGVQTATAVLETNAAKAKEEAELIKKALAEEAEVAEERDYTAKEDTEKAADKQIPEEGAPEERDAAIDAGEETPGQESREAEEAAGESGSIDEVADADEAREEADIPDDGEDGTQKPQATTKSDGEAIAANVDETSEDQPKEGDVDREAILANLEANTTNDDDRVKRETIAANLQENSQRPPASTSKPLKRASSSDRGRGAAAGPVDRAAIRAALTGKSAPGDDDKTRQ
jgi:hypothetical protein